MTREVITYIRILYLDFNKLYFDHYYCDIENWLCIDYSAMVHTDNYTMIHVFLFLWFFFSVQNSHEFYYVSKTISRVYFIFQQS